MAAQGGEPDWQDSPAAHTLTPYIQTSEMPENPRIPVPQPKTYPLFETSGVPRKFLCGTRTGSHTHILSGASHQQPSLASLKKE